MITKGSIRLRPALGAVQDILGYVFRNPLLLLEALQAPGLHKIDGCLPIRNGHKRLASVGDSVLELLVRERIYHTDLSGELARNLAKRTVCNANLIQVGKRHGIDQHIKECQGPAFKTPVTTATTVEAIIGGVYLDGGIKPVSDVLTKLGLMPHSKLTSKNLESQSRPVMLDKSNGQDEHSHVPESTKGNTSHVG